MTHRGQSAWERRDLRTTRGRHRRTSGWLTMLGLAGVFVLALPGLS